MLLIMMWCRNLVLYINVGMINGLFIMFVLGVVG